MITSDMVEVTSERELAEIVGTPVQRVVDKILPVLDDLHTEWLSHSPFCLLATSAADGSCDVSPKGDPRGFAKVLDEQTVAIPDRPGNRRVDGLRNVLGNPHVGTLFMIPPRRGETRFA